MASQPQAAATSGFALVRHGCGMPPQAGIPQPWRALAPPPSNPRSRWRKERDSNPRRLSPQRFSRPPRSTAPPSFRIGRRKRQPFFVVFRRYLAYSSAAPAYKLRSQAAPHIQSTLLNGAPHAKLRSQAAPRFQSPFKRRSQRCAPRKKSAKVPAPECVPMTFPT